LSKSAMNSRGGEATVRLAAAPCAAKLCYRAGLKPPAGDGSRFAHCSHGLLATHQHSRLGRLHGSARGAGESFRIHRHIRETIRACCCGSRTRRVALSASRSASDFQPTVLSTLSAGVTPLALDGNVPMIVSRMIAFMVLFPSWIAPSRAYRCRRAVPARRPYEAGLLVRHHRCATRRQGARRRRCRR
jgi:hypothetical protein